MAAFPVHFFFWIIGGMVAVSILAWGIYEPVWAQESARAPEHAYDDPAEERVAVPRAGYLAMIRFHVELDQCFLHGMNSPCEAPPLFPDLQDQVLAYLTRR